MKKENKVANSRNERAPLERHLTGLITVTSKRMETDGDTAVIGIEIQLDSSPHERASNKT